MTKLVGFKRFKGKKDGREYCVAEVVSDFSARELENGCAGCKAEEIFLPAEKVDYLNQSHIGKEIKFDYELSGGRAYLVDFTIVSK